MVFIGEAGIGETKFRAIGSGSTIGTAETILAEIDLTGNERAAVFHGLAISDQGEVREVHAIGFMVPEEGWTVRFSGVGCSLTATATTVEFSVVGTTGTHNWIGHVTIEFTQNYAP
jgi:hypothetical protein